MGRGQSIIIPNKTRWFGGSGGAMWPVVVIAAVCVLAVAVKVAVALTYAGPVTVTANMSPFSPNPVKVNSSATSSLSANYTPPSGVSEGDLSAQYDWSVQVQYKPLEADSFGSPPSGSYTDSISPTQPSTSSSATLTFTPLIAGYWQVSASCGVTVTDTKTNQYWSGSANAGPEDLTSIILTINPNSQDSVFLNTGNIAVVTYGPSDLNIQATISGGATFANGATTQTLTSSPTELWFYGPNVYSSGGTGSGELTVTASVPSGQSSPAVSNGVRQSAAAASSPGGNFNVHISFNIFAISSAGQQAMSTLGQSFVNSGVGILGGQMKAQENTALQDVSQSSPYYADAQEEYNYLNNEGGYSTIQNNLQSSLNNFLTGITGAPVPSSVDASQGTNTPAMPGFPASVISLSNFTPTFTAGVVAPVLGPNWTLPDPKTGNFYASVGAILNGNFNAGDLAQGTASVSTTIPYVQGFNNKVTSAIDVTAGFNFTSPIFPLAGAKFHLGLAVGYSYYNNDMKNQPPAVAATLSLSWSQ